MKDERLYINGETVSLVAHFTGKTRRRKDEKQRKKSWKLVSFIALDLLIDPEIALIQSKVKEEEEKMNLTVQGLHLGSW